MRCRQQHVGLDWGFARSWRLLAWWACCTGVAGLVAQERREEPLHVGAAAIDITPDYPVRLAGYGNRRAESAGVAQRLHAKALAISDGSTDGPVVWITYENCGLTPAIRDRVAQALQAQPGIKNERLAISVTHSHTAPCLTDWAPFIFGTDVPPEHQQHIDQYTKELTEKLITVARQAVERRRPAKLSWGTGQVRFAINRRVLRDGKWTGFGIQSDGPVDHGLPVLAVRDLQDKLVAVMANYACHCTTLGGNFNQIAGDWAGYAQTEIERDHPGCVALISIGCGADANPNPRQDDLEVCARQGRELADEVRRVLASTLRPVRGPIQCRFTQIDLPLAPARTLAEWQQMSQATDANGHFARRQLARMQAGEKLPDSQRYPVGTWTFGEDLALVHLAGEVVVDYAIRLRGEFDANRLWLTAYTNDVPCYIPSRRILREGGYEADRSMVYYGKPQQFAPEIEDLIVDTVQKLLPHWVYSPAKQADFPPPLSPAESLATMRVPDGFQIELVAAEPLVQDPVAFDWGPDGRLWVAEMRDYPNGAAWDRPGDPLGVPGGRIKLLTDDNGDGRYDRASIFLDQVPFPNSVKAWRDGVLVCAAPDIFFAADRDGDGRAEHREVLYSGFAPGNQQHRANGLRWGLDNGLYVANGDSGGSVRSVKTGEVVAISGRDLRIEPDTGRLETHSGQTQFGRCRDDWNQWFGGNNSNPLWHYVLEDPYLRRNPKVSAARVRRDVPEVPGAAPVFPISRTLARFNDFHAVNRFTSACSPEIYRDDRWQSALGPGTQVFICEPVHNLVHHAVMERDGVSFRSRRSAKEQQREFLASSDNWSRPVMARTAPDGSLWVADMYRQVIEHPEWIPTAWQRKLDLRGGSDRGRIYRISLAGESLAAIPQLASFDEGQLVAELQHSNGWRRDMAQQLLLWRQARGAVPALEAVLRQAPRPVAKAHALYILAGLGELRPAVLHVALNDAHAEVRRHAVRLSERLLDSDPQIAERVEQLVADPEVIVRFQVASSLGASKSPAVGDSLARLAARDGHEEFFAAAILSSVRAENLERLVANYSWNSRPTPLATRLLGLALENRSSPAAGQIVAGLLRGTQSLPRGERFAACAQLLVALREQRGAAEGVWNSLSHSLSDLTSQARSVAQDGESTTADRLAAIRLLGASPTPPDSDRLLLAGLLSPRQPPEVQRAAIDALAQAYPRQLTTTALAEWAAHAPALRTHILDTVATNPAALVDFLQAVSQGVVPASEVDARTRQLATTNRDRRIREQAEQLFRSGPASPRAEVVEQTLTRWPAQASPASGKGVFARRCANCHQLEQVGHTVGSELTALTDKSTRALVTAILDPNRAVEDKFVDYAATTTAGRQATGIIANETSTGVTLLGPEAKSTLLRRTEIEVLQRTGKSLMPEGLERDLTLRDLADVVAYLQSLSLPPKSFPGNVIQAAEIRDDGTIRLAAVNARIYGPTLVLEERYGNLGFWQSAADHARWTLQVPRAGRYQVRIDYACEESAAGDRLQIASADQAVTGVILGTGSWDNYRSLLLGTLELPAGTVEITARPAGSIRQALVDLRQIILDPR